MLPTSEYTAEMALDSGDFLWKCSLRTLGHFSGTQGHYKFPLRLINQKVSMLRVPVSSLNGIAGANFPVHFIHVRVKNALSLLK